MITDNKVSEDFLIRVRKLGIKELLFDNVGFQSRTEKIKLGIASMKIMYYIAGQLMKTGDYKVIYRRFWERESNLQMDMEELFSQIAA